MTLFRFFPVFLCGCLVVPTTRTTTRSLGTRDGEVYEDGDAGLDMKAEAQGSQVAVHATRLRDCHREIYAVLENRRERHLKLGGADDPRARAFGILLAPVLIPVSAIVSGISVAADEGSTTEQTRVDHVEKLRCTRPAAGLAIELVVPSGRVLRGTTDANGVATIGLPVSEPYRGVAVARAETASARIHFERPVPAVTAVRDAVLDCAATHQRTGAVRVVVVVDPDGAAASLHIDRRRGDQLAGDDELAACAGPAIARLKFPSAQRATTLVLPLALSPGG